MHQLTLSSPPLPFPTSPTSPLQLQLGPPILLVQLPAWPLLTLFPQAQQPR